MRQRADGKERRKGRRKGREKRGEKKRKKRMELRERERECKWKVVSFLFTLPSPLHCFTPAALSVAG